MVRYSPNGAGPFPTIIMNHGSASIRGVKRNVADPSLGIYFARQGWQTVFPARRGRGQSDGQYNEGHKKNSDEYACAPEESLPGVDRALSDIKAVVEHLKASRYADGKRLVMGGLSRGGILSVAYAGKHPADVAGAINFVGGWVSDQCQFADQINPGIFKRGANYPYPTIWIYGEIDTFYTLAHSRRNFAAFTAAGGKGEFLSYRLPKKQNGHFVHSRPDLWGEGMKDYLLRVSHR
jgi:dienelactone hydrolase